MTPISLRKVSIIECQSSTSELDEALAALAMGKEYAVKYQNNQLLTNPAHFKLSCHLKPIK